MKNFIQVSNDTKNVIISEYCEVADNFWTKALGLMGRKALPPSYCLYIKGCNSIHMFFMRFPIDVIFLNKNNAAIHLIKSFAPWKISPFVKGAVSVLELPSGTIEKYQMEVSDVFSFK